GGWWRRGVGRVTGLLAWVREPVVVKGGFACSSRGSRRRNPAVGGGSEGAQLPSSPLDRARAELAARGRRENALLACPARLHRGSRRWRFLPQERLGDDEDEERDDHEVHDGAEEVADAERRDNLAVRRGLEGD